MKIEVLFLIICLKNNKISYYRDICLLMVIVVVLISKLWN